MTKASPIINEYHLNRHAPDKPQFAIHDLNSYLKQHPDDTTRPHIHSFYQVIWFQQGSGKHYIDFRDYRVSENTLFFVAKNQVHYFDRQVNYEGVLIHFNELFMGGSGQGMDAPVLRNLFTNPYQIPYCPITPETADLLNAYIRQMKKELDQALAFAREALLRCYLTAFLIQAQRSKNIFETHDHQSSFSFDEKKKQLIQFADLVNENYNKGLGVAEYARLLFVSTRTLSNLTSQLLNKSPSQMIQERIILEAQRLLVHSDLNINQIGYHLGFDDPSYFVKYFKKHTNMSPSEFRKTIA